MSQAPPELRLGDWRAVLADVGQVDAVICDAPYSDRTHQGHFAGTQNSVQSDPEWLARRGYDCKRSKRQPLTYEPFTPADVITFVGEWAPRCRGWFVTITDHQLAPAWEESLRAAGLYVFAPLPFVEIGKQPRLTGDGPASWSCWIVVARPRSRAFASFGSLPGAYCTRRKSQRDRIVGGKPLWLMRALVRDYTRPGDLIADPCAGYGTTLRAAVIEGRRAIGAEIDPDTHAKAVERLAQPYTPCVQFERLEGEQGGLFGEVGT